jgi:hypothetical protein
MVAYLQWAAGVVAVAYAVAAFYAWQYSDGLIFLPPPPTYPAGADLLAIPTADGGTLAARYLPYPEARYTLIDFHGNAEDLGQVEPHLRELRDRLGVAVLAWDYRGYGRSGGQPGEPATLRDACAVAAYATRTLGVPPDRLVLYGWSLGGGPAVEVAASQPCAGLVLHSAFTSAFRVMTRIRLLPFDKFDNLAKLPHVTCPVLVIHGMDDRTIPFGHGRRLYTAAPGSKYKLWVEGAGHNDLIEIAGEDYWRTLREFIAGL